MLFISKYNTRAHSLEYINPDLKTPPIWSSVSPHCQYFAKYTGVYWNLNLGEATKNKETHLDRCDHLSLIFTLPNLILTQLSLFKIIKFPMESHLWVPEVRRPVRLVNTNWHCLNKSNKAINQFSSEFLPQTVKYEYIKIFQPIFRPYIHISWLSMTVSNLNTLPCVPKYGSKYTVKKYFKLQLIQK